MLHDPHRKPSFLCRCTGGPFGGFDVTTRFSFFWQHSPTSPSCPRKIAAGLVLQVGLRRRGCPHQNCPRKWLVPRINYLEGSSINYLDNICKKIFFVICSNFRNPLHKVTLNLLHSLRTTPKPLGRRARDVDGPFSEMKCVCREKR